MNLTAPIRLALPVAVLLSVVPHAQSPAPLPDATTFLAEARRHVRFSLEQPEYAYVQRETEVRLDGDGRPTSKTTRVYEIYPGADGVAPYKRLVSRDGVAISSVDLERSDRKRQEEVLQRIQDLRVESAGDRSKRLQEAAERRREHEAIVDDVLRVCDIRMVGRDVVAGRPAIVFTFSPRPDAKAQTRPGGIAQKFGGRAWIDEQDHEMVRVEARAIDDVTYGLGMFARIYKGTAVEWERRKVNDEVWLPTRLDVRANARILLFRRLGLHLVTDYFGYRKFTVSTSTTFGGGGQ